MPFTCVDTPRLSLAGWDVLVSSASLNPGLTPARDQPFFPHNFYVHLAEDPLVAWLTFKGGETFQIIQIILFGNESLSIYCVSGTLGW